MNAERLLAHYERIADAPDAIARLRRFVLDLAVRGKLVPQDPSDEPASELLKRIAKEKIDQADLPNGWRRARIGAILDFQYGKGLKASERADEGPVPVFGSNGIVGFTDEALTVSPSIIVGRKGSAGALNLCDGPSWTTDVAYFVEVPSFFTIRFLLNALAALDLDKLGKGVKPGLSRSDAYEQILCVPPLAEQRRIVAKVDELMALCDRLEAARGKREAVRDRLAAASLVRLNAPDPETFHADARFALDVLPALTTRPDQIKQLRQTILNLSVRGKLVPQDPKDNAVRLPPLRQFAAASGMDDEVFEQTRDSIVLPNGWQIAPLAQLSEHIVDCPHTTPKWTDHGEICIRTNQLRPRSLDLSEPRYVSPEAYLERIERLEPTADDILYSREGGILGIACRVPKGVRLCLGQRLMLIRAGTETSADFLEIVLNSPFITDIAKARTTGGAAPRVNMSTVRAYPIPVPPLAEQRRIVAKVDELMALCDRLEASLTTGDDTRRRLLDALLAEALRPAEALDREAAE
jgi:type I restriction enzyme S subunit